MIKALFSVPVNGNGESCKFTEYHVCDKCEKEFEISYVTGDTITSVSQAPGRKPRGRDLCPNCEGLPMDHKQLELGTRT